MLVSSPMDTPCSVISTSGHSVQFGHSVNLTCSIRYLLDCRSARTVQSVVATEASPFENVVGIRDRRTVAAHAMQYRDDPLLRADRAVAATGGRRRQTRFTANTRRRRLFGRQNASAS